MRGSPKKNVNLLRLFVQLSLDNMTAQLAYDHIANFIAAMNPAKVLELQAPEAARLRLEELVELEKAKELSPAEKDELDHFIVLERLIRLAKADARLKLANA